MTFQTNPSDRSRRIRRSRFTPKGTISTPPQPMCPCCEAEARGLSPAQAEAEYLEAQERRIEKYGRSICYVTDAKPWAYTIGRTRLGLPELVVFGLEPETTQSILNSICDQWPDTSDVDAAIDDLEETFPGLRFLVVPDRIWDASEYLLGAAEDARRFAPGKHRLAIQVVWSDPRGTFPWEPLFDPRSTATQPILGFMSE
jgi:hypothetical protein